MTKKKPEPNPIEEAIGNRAKTPETPSQVLKDVPDQPILQSEMLRLEELNRRTVERLQEPYPEEPVQMAEATHPVPKVPVLKPENQPVTKTSSPESPPQKDDDLKMALTGIHDAVKDFKLPKGVDEKIEKDLHPQNENAIGELDALVKESFPETCQEDITKFENITHLNLKPQSAEEVELTALRQYILEDGFVVATVAFHIVSLCAQPMTTPSTTTWNFKDRAMIPDMVLALLNQPGYLEGIWPSLRIVMGSNKGNAAWTAGIATTIAFFDVIRTLPTIVELKNESNEK